MPIADLADEKSFHENFQIKMVIRTGEAFQTENRTKRPFYFCKEKDSTTFNHRNWTKRPNFASPTATILGHLLRHFKVI